MRRVVAVLVATVVFVTACGSDDGGSTADGGGGEGATFNEADVAFAQDMIVHHRQAVEMAAVAEGRTDSEAVQDLASRIQAAQDPEIELLQGWLEEWGEATEADDAMDHGQMAGMMSDEDMAMLEGADGPAFDEQFLEMMAVHHRGAIEMAETELDEGASPEALALAEEVITAQSAEIEEIEELLADPD